MPLRSAMIYYGITKAETASLCYSGGSLDDTKLSYCQPCALRCYELMWFDCGFGLKVGLTGPWLRGFKLPSDKLYCVIVGKLDVCCLSVAEDNVMSAEKALIKRLLDHYEYAGVVGRPVINQSETINVSYGIGLIQLLDLDEKNQILTTNVWCRYVSRISFALSITLSSLFTYNAIGYLKCVVRLSISVQPTSSKFAYVH